MLACAHLLLGACAAAPVPRHLELARDLVRDVPPETTTYQHSPTVVEWAHDGRPATCRADCSGFLNEVFKSSLAIDGPGLSTWLNRDRPLALDYFRAISAERGFIKIDRIADAAPGDLIAIKYEPGAGNSGHVMLVDAPAREVAGAPPLVAGTTQWRVRVIDCSSTGHGPGDTRYEGGRKVRTGLGAGEFRLYVDGAGVTTGHTFTTASDSPFRAQNDRPVVIGRPTGHRAQRRGGRRPVRHPPRRLSRTPVRESLVSASQTRCVPSVSR